MNGLSGLYAIVDLDACERRRLSPERVARSFFDAGVGTVQLRAKGRPDAVVLELLTSLVQLRGALATRIFANDRPDLAHLAGADGVHLGQEDLPVEVVRAAFPKLAIGLSTHDEAQLRAALARRPEYVALGPLRPTRSKERPEPVVSEACLVVSGALARSAGVPLVGIGGLDRETIPLVGPHLSSVALIGALLAEEGTNEEAADAAYASLAHTAREYDALVRRSCRSD